MVNIVGLSGVAGVGKDFIANILCKDYGFVKVAFADPIKRVCRDIFDFTEEQLWGPSEKRNEPDKRYPRTVASFDQGDAYEAMLHGIPDPGMTEYLTPRYTLQRLGTEWGRECYENVWVDYALRTAKAIDGGGCIYDSMLGLRTASWVDSVGPYGTVDVRSKKNVVIPDVRFRNELDALQKSGAKVVRIRRSKGTTLDADAAMHASERDQAAIPDADFDFILHNIEDHSKLKVSINEMMKVLER